MSNRLAALISSIRRRKSLSNALYEGRHTPEASLSPSHAMAAASGSWSGKLVSKPFADGLALEPSLRHRFGWASRSLRINFSTSLWLFLFTAFGGACGQPSTMVLVWSPTIDGLLATFGADKVGSLLSRGAVNWALGVGIDSRSTGLTIDLRGVDDKAGPESIVKVILQYSRCFSFSFKIGQQQHCFIVSRGQLDDVARGPVTIRS